MAYVNVASWTSDQVAEWIKGLSDHEAMQSYARHLQAANITGSRLLQLRPGELRQLHITRVGHQEVILAAISRLQTLHFTLNSENLQQLAMRLCSKARCLYNELCREQPPVAPGGRQRVTVPILEAVTDTMTSVKDIIGWLNTLDCCDSLSLLPAPLLIMTIKRKPDEPLGLHIVRAISGVPIITGVKFQSPAHHCGKLEEGDEIVQVNYQTVVGWQLGKVIDLLQDKESGTDVYLTVKKRPKHSNLIDQVYFKQFRLPNKKRTPYRWNSSPRPDLLASLPKITLPPKLSSPEALEAELTPQPSSDSDSEAFLPEAGSAAASPTSVRHYLPKPRPTLQRRATVTGASPHLAATTGLHRTVSSLPEQAERTPPPPPADKPRLEKTQSAPAYDVGRREESFERVLRELPRRPAIEEETDSGGNPLPFGPAAGAGAGPVSAEKDLQNSEHSDSPAPLSTVSEATYESGSPIELEVPTESEAAEPNSLPEPGSNTPPDVGEEEATKTPQETPEEVAEGTPNTESSEAPRAEWPSGRPAPSDGPADGSTAVHPTVLLLSGATEDESSSDMPSALKDASPLREMIEKMDVAFRGLKTSLSDLSRPEGSPLTPDGTPPAQPGSRGGPAVLLRQHSRLSFKGRRVSCRDLGQGDCQGWLHMKKEGRGFLHADKWAKRWLVLHGHKLYGYKDKESQQAETLISLPGYQVSPANDIRSKRHAFRVYSNERSVVFASDSQLDMTKWMNKMGLSAIAYDSTKTFTTGGFSRPDRDGTHVDMYFSDTDDEDSKKKTPLKRPPMQRGRVTPSPTSSLDRARQKLRNWRTGSPVPSAGSLSSLSSLGSERPAIKKKPSLRFLARVRRDSGQSAVSVGSVVSTESQRRASQPETSGDRVKEARMRFAFEMDLDGGGDDVFEPAGVSRPRPPPRLAKSASASQVSMGSGRERPSITIQLQSEGAAIGAEEPRTPRKPAMGVSMIGKQRRTPTSTSSSPHFVFPSAPLSPSGSPSPGPGAETTGISRGIAAHGTLSPPPALAKSQTSPALGWGLRVLPRYGLQYPPVFTPDTYSLEQMSGSAAETASLGPAWADRCYADSATQTEAGRAEGAASLAPPTSTAGDGARTLRRKNTLKGRRRRGSLRTEGMLRLLALQRAVKAKQAEVDSISDLLRTPVTHTRLERWLSENQGLLDRAGSAPDHDGETGSQI
ncbi:Connector enhancer of kinase suppressor of ras 2 [Amphibalanus amphitrite]|uniref:Connector enhancer of kinase suppressor of ras 2 n=1 Tax=Amphibalanus amphitrite TaxID=1232801 RepID=A0A6A4X6N4_AMPAM|nr:Connector enhancer of kinase suppressor of ras 2 [Amphibalanus amphitrite]